jgi:hypothetical protein
MAERPEDRVENLQRRLREAAEHIEALRREAVDLAAELRNRLHAIVLRRQAVERLDRNRQERIENQSGARHRGDQRQRRAA